MDEEKETQEGTHDIYLTVPGAHLFPVDGSAYSAGMFSRV